MYKRAIFIILACIGAQLMAQNVLQKTIHFHDPIGRIMEENIVSYDSIGRVTKDYTKDYKYKSISCFEYFYEGNKLIKEVNNSKHWEVNSVGKKTWWGEGDFSRTFYSYDSLGQLILKKEYGFACQFDTADMEKYFYQNGKLARVLYTRECSYSPNSYMYPYQCPTYYLYDKNDSLVAIQGMYYADTTKIWSLRTYDYQTLPNGLIYEWYFRDNDTLKIDQRSVTQDHFNQEGLKIITVVFDSLGKNDTIYYKYNKKNLLIIEYTIRDGKELSRKTTYKYYPDGLEKLKKFYWWDPVNDKKLKYKYCYKYMYKP